MSLSDKQKQVVDDFIITGNQTESYLKFYKNVKKRETAAVLASRLFDRDDVKAYKAMRLSEKDDKTIAKQDEVLSFLTSVMRGEKTEKTLIGVAPGEQDVTDIDVSMKDRIKAAELIGKRFGLWTDKVDMEMKIPTIIFDVPEADDE